MVNILNCRKWTYLPLIGVVLMIACHVVSVHAAVLKDIRIGEHDDFTRIVFEFDAPMATDRFSADAPGRLSVVFQDVAIGLTRKISLESSRHLQDIQIWQRKDQLSAVVLLNIDHYEHKSFLLSQPPRVALDIYPLSQAPPPAAPAAPVSRSSAEDASELSIPPKESGPPKESDSGPTEESGSGSNNFPLSPEYSSEKQRSVSSTGMTANTPASSPLEHDPISSRTEIHDGDNADTSRSVDTSPQDPAASSGKTESPAPSSLQFYLVIGLVAITILILIMLLLMLFSKRHWVGEKSPRNVMESLKSQEERIDRLNARIKEQFKRYEEV